MRLEWRRWFERVEALICTGMPGVFRVVVFASLQHVYTLDALGRTASEMSLAQLASCFTAIGWASLILVRVPMATKKHLAVDVFYGISFMAALTTIAVSIAAFGVAAVMPPAFDASSFVLLLCGWSSYQLARHFFVASRSYRVAITFDLLLIACSHAALLVCRARGLSSSFALALALLTGSLCMFAAIGLPSHLPLRRDFDIKGLQFGMTNFLSGGIALLFIPFATMTCGVEFGGAFSLMSSITAVAVLLPRAISTTQLPQLAKLVAAGLPIERPVQAMRRTVLISNVVVLGVNAVLIVSAVRYGVRSVNVEHRYMVVLAGLLLAVQNATAMGSAVASSLLMVFEKARETAIVNFKTTALFAVSCVVILAFPGPIGFLLVLGASIAIGAVRNRLIAKHAGLALAAYTEGRR